MTDSWGPTRVLAIRHGETDWNVNRRIQGQLDLALNRVGVWQAQCLSRALSHESVEAVYTSDLARARDTAQGLAQAVDLPLRLDADLRERQFGLFQGLTVDDIMQRWPEDAVRWRQRDPHFAPEGGESLAQFSQRCVHAVMAIATRHPGQTIAVVTHGGVLDCLYRAATHLDLQAPRTWALANTSINRLLHTGLGLTLIGWADTSHLDGEVPPWGGDGAACRDEWAQRGPPGDP